MNAHLPAPADYYRPARARELRRRATRLDRCVLWGVVAYFSLITVGWFNVGPVGVMLFAWQGVVIGVPVCLGLWMAADACCARATRLDLDHQARFGGQTSPAPVRRRFSRPKLQDDSWLVVTTLVSMALVWAGGLRVPWRSSSSYFEARLYFASSPQRPIFWHPAPRVGLDCQHRMICTGQGEVARSLRFGDLVVEVSQEHGIGSGPSVLDGSGLPLRPAAETRKRHYPRFPAFRSPSFTAGIGLIPAVALTVAPTIPRRTHRRPRPRSARVTLHG